MAVPGVAKDPGFAVVGCRMWLPVIRSSDRWRCCGVVVVLRCCGVAVLCGWSAGGGGVENDNDVSEGGGMWTAPTPLVI